MTPESGTSGSSPNPSSSRQAWIAATAIAFVFAASRVAILGAPTEREYDEGVYLLSARSVAAGHRLFTQVFSSQPPAFLESLALALRVFGDRMETGRLVMLAFSLVSLASIADLGRRLFGPWAAPAAAAALALSMTFGDLAHVVQAETPALAASLASLSACLEARRRGWSIGWLAFSGALLATGCLFKLTAVPTAAPLALLLLLEPAGVDQARWRFDGSGLALLRRAGVRAAVLAAGAAPVFGVPLLVYDLPGLYEQTVAFHLAKQEVYRLALSDNVRRAASHLVADGAIAAAAAIGATMTLRRGRRLTLVWLLAWLVVMLAAVVQQRPLFWRHFVLLCPPLALFASAAVGLAAERAAGAWKAAPLLCAVALWTAAGVLDRGRDSAIFPLWPEARRAPGYERGLGAATKWIRTHTDPGEFIVSDDPLVVYLAGRQSPPGICDTSLARIAAGSLTLEIATRETAGARTVVLRRDGRLSRLRGYLPWVARHYDRQGADATGVAEGRAIWIRRGPAAGDS